MIKTLKELSDLIDSEQGHPSIDRASKRITLSLAEVEILLSPAVFAVKSKALKPGESVASFRTYSIFVK